VEGIVEFGDAALLFSLFRSIHAINLSNKLVGAASFLLPA
jgi:hypothetical protein